MSESMDRRWSWPSGLSSPASSPGPSVSPSAAGPLGQITPAPSSSNTPERFSCEKPCRHHPFSTKYPHGFEFEHVKNLEVFVEELNETLEGVFPNRAMTYSAVHALLISWGPNDDLGTEREIQKLEALFDRYGYTPERYDIPPVNSQNALETKLSNIWEEHAQVGQLLIVYYGGHGDYKDGHSLWQAWQIRPPTAKAPITRRQSPQLRWTTAMGVLLRANGDVLFVLDCCHGAFTATSECSGGLKELLVATSPEQKTTGVNNNSFTTAFTNVLDESNGSPLNAVRVHERLVNRHEQCNILMPHYVPLWRPVNAPSISLSPMGGSIASMSCPDATSDPTDCRILISVHLDDSYQLADLTEWRRWFSHAAPRNIGKVEIRLEAAWRSTSTYCLFSMPPSVWNALPLNPAYSMLAVIKSENLVETSSDTTDRAPKTPLAGRSDSGLVSRTQKLWRTVMHAIQRRRPVGHFRIVKIFVTLYKLLVSFLYGTVPDPNPERNIAGSVKLFRLQVSALSKPQMSSLPRTESPVDLFLRDILILFRRFRAIPVKTLILGAEIYPSWNGLKEATFHCLLAFSQLCFLATVPLSFLLLIGAHTFAYLILALLVSQLLSLPLNGFDILVESSSGLRGKDDSHPHERWMFVNGTAVGRCSMSAYVDHLSFIFGRRILGVHSQSFGLLDMVRCFLERDFHYATRTTRLAYFIARKFVHGPEIERMILIVHGHGGVVGSQIVDWLLTEVPRDCLRKVEVYTFGCAADHFNNPKIHVHGGGKATPGSSHPENHTAIGHIEHYANSNDLISQMGILGFVRSRNQYMGQLFVRSGDGHAFRRDYLDKMFPLGSDMSTLDSNSFMESDVELVSEPSIREESQFEKRGFGGGRQEALHGRKRVKDFSRLWLYRNGGTPLDARSPWGL